MAESSAKGHALKGAEEPKIRLARTLLPPKGSPEEAALDRRLAEMNALDLELWDFANDLVDERERWQQQQQQQPSSAVVSAAANALFDLGGVKAAAVGCGSPGGFKPFAKPRNLADKLGIHRPPGHKQ